MLLRTVKVLSMFCSVSYLLLSLRVRQPFAVETDKGKLRAL